MECKHEWLSDENGVTCLICGLHLTQDEFQAYLRDEKLPQKTSKRRKAKDA